MARWLPGCLILAVLAANFGAAQDSSTKKLDRSNSQPPPSNSQPPSAPKSTKPDETAPEPFRDDLPSVPGGKVWLTPEKFKELEDRYQKLRDQLQLQERLRKKERLPTSTCMLSGRVEGDVADLKAVFDFTTPEPMCVVFLGLKNGFLRDEGLIDEDGVPHLETADDGYVVRVDKAGKHRATLNLRVPIVARKSAANNERGFDLGLPEAAVTTLALDLPATVKDVRANDKNLISPRAGHWETPLGSPKTLAASWKEPAAAANAAIGPAAHTKLKVKIEEGRIELAGELTLEDGKTPLREWQVLLPTQIKISPAPGSPDFVVIPPDAKTNAHVIRVKEKADKITLALQAQYPRVGPQQKLPIGPVLVQGTPIQGSILVQAAPGAMRGQRLLYYRYGEIFQRDPPKSTPGVVDNLAQFQFWNAPYSGKGLSPAKAALELEWKAEKGQVDASVEHELRPRENDGKWQIDVESRFVVQTANTGIDTLDLQLPTPFRAETLWIAGVQPSLGFPAALRWPILSPRPTIPIGVSASEADNTPIDVPPPDAQNRVRLKLSKAIGKDMIVKVKTTSVGSLDASHFLVELPRLVGVQDRGAKVIVWSPPGQELLVGSSGPPEPVQDRYQQSFEQMPAGVDVGWRESQRERSASAVVDLFVHATGIQVRQTLLLPVASWTGGPLKTDQLALRLPHGVTIKELNVPLLSTDKSLAWVKLPPEAKDHFEIRLDYDVSLKPTGDKAIVVPLVWPERTTTRDAKLRIWTEGGVTPTLVGLGDVWKDRPLEQGPTSWTSLVAVGAAAELSVALVLEQAAGHRLPSLVAERSLVQVRVDDDGSQTYRCRYLVRKFAGPALEVTLPVAWDQGQPRFRVAGKDVGGVKVVDPLVNLVSVPLSDRLPQPTLLEIEYRIPAAHVDGRRVWRTPLTPPRIGRDPVYGPTRWQISLPGNQTPLVLDSTTVDYRWALTGWLLSPEPSVTSSDLDAWIGSPDAADDGSISLAWWRSTVEPQQVYHFSRQFWLVICSGAVLFFGLLLLLTPLPRFILGLVVLLTGLGFVALGLVHEYFLPTLLLGCQPGLAVLIAVASFQWLLHERTRRQLIFMPSFTRVPQGSTVVRQQKSAHNPSTIDSPIAGSGSKG